MTQPCRTDPAIPIMSAAIQGLRTWFDPGAVCKAEVGTTETIRLFAGDGAPLAAWDAHAMSGGGCKEPFIWVRAMRRYRSSSFPSPTIATNPCGLPRVMPVELGVGWCAEVGEPDRAPSWEAYDREARVSMDTSWRLEEALCTASGVLDQEDVGRQIGVDTLVPYGPEGGVIAWTGVLYATY